MLELSQIQILMAVNQSESLSQAADFLNITQSAVSQSLKSIESRLGFPVITRQGKKVVLTSGAKKMAVLGKTYVKKFEGLIEEIQQDSNKIQGSVSLGTMSGIGKSWIAHRMIEFSGFFPDISVKISMDFPNELLSQFDRRDLDCLILPASMTPAHCEHKKLHDEFATLVFPKKSDFNISNNTTLKELSELPLIFFEDHDPLFFEWCRERYGNVPRNVKPRIVVNAFGQILQAVCEGLGVAVIPTHVLHRSYFKDKVNAISSGKGVSSNQFNFIYHTEEKNSLKMKTLFDFLEKEVKNLNL